MTENTSQTTVNVDQTLPLLYTRISNVVFKANNAVAISKSPFTFASQVHAYTGQSWSVDVSYPAMQRDDAEEVVSFLINLQGPKNTFKMGDPNAQNSLEGLTENVTLSSDALARSEFININTLSGNENFRVGDYIELGDQFLKVVSVAGSTLGIWPHLRRQYNQGDVVYYTKPKGLFRLSSPSTSFSINNVSLYGISFSAEEVV